MGRAGESMRQWDISIEDAKEILASSESARLKSLLQKEAVDWADTDTQCREMAKRVLDEKVVDGDSHCVPSVADLCEWMADEIERLKAGRFTEEEFQNLCHTFDGNDRCRFERECIDYQEKLFGKFS